MSVQLESCAGGEIVHFGMPVDPGNLICVGRIKDKPALVLPGCARSPKLNGIDFILTRLFAGLKVTSGEIMRMGVGGLLKEFDNRPLPREKAPATPRSGAAPRSAPTIAAIVMAAGRSHRMAPDCKLLVTDQAGKPDDPPEWWTMCCHPTRVRFWSRPAIRAQQVEHSFVR